MEKFNNTTLFTGYLKQLLSDFNLPKYRVYTRENAEYFDKYKKESPEIFETITKTFDNEIGAYVYPNQIRYIPYIKDGTIQEYIDGKWINIGEKENVIGTTKSKYDNGRWVEAYGKGKVPKHAHYYSYNQKILNHTRNLKIQNNSYDSYTHEYLGDYLRFKRDFLGINLMPLYNCFSNRLCDSLKLNISLNSQRVIKFDTNDTGYKIYMLPVKLFKEYTIAIDSEAGIELCCGLYGSYQDERRKFENIPALTYKRIPGCNFSQPVVYDALAKLSVINNEEATPVDRTTLIELAQNECDLKLFIKIPQSNTSTIVILEGDYHDWNDFTADEDGKMTNNKMVLNFENLPEELPTSIQLKTPLQLLRFNTRSQHPFADRLIEYLIGQSITSEDEISENIKRVQKTVRLNTKMNNNGYQYVYLETGKEPEGFKENFPQHMLEEDGTEIKLNYISLDDNKNQYANTQKVYRTLNESYPNILLCKVYLYNYRYEPFNNGVWENHLTYSLYDYMNVNHNDDFIINHDILGYVDKSVEKYYYYTDPATEISTSMANVELEEE